MTNFNTRLNKVLSEDFVINEMPMSGGIGGPDAKQFLQFLNAIVTSADHARSDMAIKKALNMPPEQLSQIVSQTQSIGNLSGLADYIRSKPSRIMSLIDIARILYQGLELEQVVDSMMATTHDDNEVYDEDGDFYYDQGDDSDGH